jgi:RHS repeat-associated protein
LHALQQQDGVQGRIGAMAMLFRKRSMLGAFMASTALSAPAYAQYVAPTDTPPIHSRVDEFNVDLVTHKMAGTEYGTVSLGPDGPGGLTWIWSDSSRLASDLQTNNLVGGTVDTSHTALIVGGASKSFTLSGSLGTGTFSDDLGAGETLTYNSSNGQYTYTSRNGTVLLLGSTTGAYGYLYGYPISLTYPAGEQLTWNRDASNIVRSITSNLGYQLRPTYDATNVTWTKVVLFNMADVACDPVAVSCSITGTWPTIDFTAKTVNGQPAISNVWVSDPNTGGWTITQTIPTTSTTSRTVVYKEGSDNVVTSVTDGKGTWTYSFPQPGIAPVALRIASDRAAYYDETNWDSNGNFVSIKTTTEDGYKQFNYTYDANQRVKTTAVDGIVTTYTYDDRGNITQASTAPKSGGSDLPIVTKASFPPTCTNAKTCNQPSSTTDANNNTTDYTYDPNSGGVASIAKPAQPNGVRPTATFTYAIKNAQWLSGTGSTVTGGNVYKVGSVSRCMTQSTCAGTADEVRTVPAYSVSDGLEPASITVQSGNGSVAATSSYTYSATGDVASIDGPLSGPADTTYYYFDTFHRATGIVGPDPDGGGSLPRRAATNAYNFEGQSVSTNLGTSTTTGVAGMTVLQSETIAYNAQGLKSQASTYDKNNALAAITQYSYTPSQFAECIARRVSTANVPASACAQSTGNPDHIMKFAYTGASSPAEVRNGFVSDSQTADLINSWTGSGLAGQTDGKGNVTSYAHDDFDRLSSTCYPNPNRSTDCEILTYDPVGNITSRRLRDASTLLSYTYDALNRLKTKVLPEGTVTVGYDNLGEVTSVAQGATTLSFTYDQLGRNLTQVGPQGTMTSSWDPAGRRTSLTYPGSFAITYDYLVTNELNHIYDAAGTLATYSYDELGNRALVSYANGTSESYTFDALYRLNRLTNSLGGTTYNLCSTFGYNAASDLTSRTQRTPGCSGTTNAYGWNGATGYGRTYSTNALNQYTSDTSVSFGYDALGNLSQTGSTYYCYNSENHLINVGASATCTSPSASLAYDPSGRLAGITKSGTTTNFAYDGLDVIGEYNGSTLTKRYVFGPDTDEPIASYDSAGNRTFMMSDERGSITAFSNDAGTVTAAINGYDEYGIPNTNSSGVDQNTGRFGYTGQMWLGEIGMASYKNRIYSPTLGRFLQADPIGYGDGPNWYAYAHNDPVNGSDPLGLNCDDVPPEDILVCGSSLSFGGGDSGVGGGGGGGSSGPSYVPGTPGSSNSPLCNNRAAVAFVRAHRAAAAALAAANGNSTEEILGLSLAEVGVDGNSLSNNGNNFFSMEGGNSRSLPFAIGTGRTKGGTVYATYSSYYDSGRSFLAVYGSKVRGIKNPTKFAQALVPSYNTANSKTGGTNNFVANTASVIRSTAVRLKCP